MAVHTFSYPLSLPSTPAQRTIELLPDHKTAITRGEFSFVRQSHDYNADHLGALVTLPPMKRADAAEWMSVFLNLKGVGNTFLMGIDAHATARGIATGTPQVKGASQTGDELITDGWTATQTGIMKAFDGFSIANKLILVTEDANSDGSGDATLTIWPYIQTAFADNASIDVSSPKGTWYLTSTPPLSIDRLQLHGVSFSCEHVEV